MKKDFLARDTVDASNGEGMRSKKRDMSLLCMKEKGRAYNKKDYDSSKNNNTMIKKYSVPKSWREWHSAIVLFVQPKITAPRSCSGRFLAVTKRFVGLPLTTWLHEDFFLTIALS